MSVKSLKQVAPCPRCRGMGGWYEKRVCKYTQIFEADGKPFDAGDMTRVREGDRRYCIECNRDITEQVQMVE